MKTIEERAREFIAQASAGQDVPEYITEVLVQSYCAGANEELRRQNDEYERRNKWHDFEEEKPRLNDPILLCVEFENENGATCYSYDVGRYIKLPYAGFMLEYQSTNVERFATTFKRKVMWREIPE